MCLIIDRPVGVDIPGSLTKKAIENNPHGWGIMLHNDRGSISIHRGLGAKQFAKALQSVGDQACVIHFRYATHGSIGLKNCHPFTFIGNKYALVHNGVLDEDVAPIRDKSRSDTWHFTNDILAPFLKDNPESLTDSKFLSESGKFIGSGNKIVVLGPNRTKATINRSSGYDWEGLWLSNTACIWAEEDFYATGGWKWSRRKKAYVSQNDINDEVWDDNPLDERSRWTLEALAELGYDGIRETCERDPDHVASLIEDYFG